MPIPVIELEPGQTIDLTMENNLYRKEYAGKLVIQRSPRSWALFSKDRAMVYYLADWVVDLLRDIGCLSTSSTEKPGPLQYLHHEPGGCSPVLPPVSAAELKSLAEVFKADEILALRKSGVF